MKERLRVQKIFPQKNKYSIDRVIQRRLQNPYFRIAYENIVNGQISYDYNGINLNNGEILKLEI